MSSVIARPDSQVEDVFLNNKDRNNIDDIENFGGRIIKNIVKSEPEAEAEVKAENSSVEDENKEAESLEAEQAQEPELEREESAEREERVEVHDEQDLEELEAEDKAEAKEPEPEFVGMFHRDVVNFLGVLEKSLHQEQPLNKFNKLYLGFDLGTTNLVLVALNEDGEPVSAVMEASGSSVRDGVVVDYMGALHGMQKCLDRLHSRLGDFEAIGAAAYPPGISIKTAKVCSNVVESLGYDCGGLYEEPVAAAESLAFKDAAIVDIGGGTTGISVLQDGKSVYTADEPTGGTHMTLVLSGNMGISFEEAEQVKRNPDPARKRMLVPILKPVLEKMGSIIKNHLEISGYFGKVPVIVCGGGAVLPTAEEILSNAVGDKVVLAPSPLLVTPAGIALSLEREIKRREAEKIK